MSDTIVKCTNAFEISLECEDLPGDSWGYGLVLRLKKSKDVIAPPSSLALFLVIICRGKRLSMHQAKLHASNSSCRPWKILLCELAKYKQRISPAPIASC